MVKFSQDHFKAILSIFDLFAHIELASPCKVTRGGGVTQHSEIQPGLFSGHFKHFFYFLAILSSPPTPLQ